MKKKETNIIQLPEEELHPDLFGSLIKKGEDTYVRHFLIWSHFPVNPYGKSGRNSLVNWEYSTKKVEYNGYLKNKNYDDILVLLDKQTQMGWFIKNYKRINKDIGDEKYYKMFREILTYVDNHDEVRKHYSKLLTYGKDHLQMMSKKERKQFNKLPDTFTIYRGTSSDKLPTSSNVKKLLGNSWTNDKKTSKWFSQTHSPKFRGSKYNIILNYQVKKSEIISWFSERGEKEVFMDFTKIDVSKVKWEIIPPKKFSDKDLD